MDESASTATLLPSTDIAFTPTSSPANPISLSTASLILPSIPSPLHSVHPNTLTANLCRPGAPIPLSFSP